MDTFCQTPAEFHSNCTEVAARLLKNHGAVLANTDANGRRLSDYLIKNNMRADGKVNATANNILSAILALHTIGYMEWVTAPAPPKKPQMVQGLTKITNEMDHIIEANREQAKENARRGAEAATRREEEAVTKILRDCEYLTRSAHRTTVSKQEQLREALTKDFNDGLANLKRNVSNKTHSQQMKEAQALQTKMKALVDSDQFTTRDSRNSSYGWGNS